MSRILAVGVLLAGIAFPAAAAERPTLTVYTYSSFTADWGPGPAIKKAFEAECDCTLDFIGLEGGLGILSRLSTSRPSPSPMKSRVQPHSASNAFLIAGPGPQSAVNEPYV